MSEEMYKNGKKYINIPSPIPHTQGLVEQDGEMYIQMFKQLGFVDIEHDKVQARFKRKNSFTHKIC